MNTSNRFGIETLARQHQAEIEKHILQTSQLRAQRHEASPRGLKAKWAARVVALSVLGLIAAVIAANIH